MAFESHLATLATERTEASASIPEAQRPVLETSTGRKQPRGLICRQCEPWGFAACPNPPPAMRIWANGGKLTRRLPGVQGQEGQAHQFCGLKKGRGECEDRQRAPNDCQRLPARSVKIDNKIIEGEKSANTNIEEMFASRSTHTRNTIAPKKQKSVTFPQIKPPL